MESLFFIFIAFILLVIILSGSSEGNKSEKKDYTENFKMYFYSLPEEGQKSFINSLDYIHKLQFEDYLKSEDSAMPEFFINEFNNWVQYTGIEIEPFDLNNNIKLNSTTYDDNIFNDCNLRNGDSVLNRDNEINFNNNDISNDSNSDNSKISN